MVATRGNDAIHTALGPVFCAVSVAGTLSHVSGSNQIPVGLVLAIFPIYLFVTSWLIRSYGKPPWVTSD